MLSLPPLVVLLLEVAILFAAATQPASVAAFAVSGLRPRTAAEQQQRLNLFPSSPSNRKDDGTSSAATAEMDAIERQVLESARASVDVNRVLRALETDTDDNNLSRYDNQQVATPWSSSHIQIAVAASLVAGFGTFVLLEQNYYLALFVAGFVFVAAFLDEDDTLAGALARILGRTTLQSLEATQPRVRALARAVVTGEEEISLLKRRVAELALENEELRQWKEQRIQVDEALPRFKVDELRSMARENGLVAKGTKMDLLLRLVEAGALDLD